MTRFINDEAVGNEGVKVLACNDWLGATPYFFDLETRRHGESIHDVSIGARSMLDFEPEGLAGYLDCGISVFGTTPLRNVRFLGANSELLEMNDGALAVREADDPFFSYISNSGESEVVERFRESVQEWEARIPDSHDIVLPLSGGYDSRLLMWAVRDKERIRAFTYGLSSNQGRSFEAQRAASLCRQFGIRWELIELGGFHNHLQNWKSTYGMSVHAHGMYQIEFYSRIRDRIGSEHSVLSGIIGDLLAGSLGSIRLNGPSDLWKLAHSHGIRADPKYLKSKSSLRPSWEKYWEKHSTALEDPRYRELALIRTKMMLLRYLLEVPRSLGFDSWSPFTDQQVALSMLFLSPERRKNRSWQTEFFQREGLFPKDSLAFTSFANNLDSQAILKSHLPPLDLDFFSSFLDEAYINWINRWTAPGPLAWAQSKLLGAPKVEGLTQRLRLDFPMSRAYAAYLCLYPLSPEFS